MLNVVYTMCFWKHKLVKLNKINPEIVYKVLKVCTYLLTYYYITNLN